MRTALRALLATVVLALLTGIAYPLVVTGIAQIAAPASADGSLVTRGSVTVGAERIGQRWDGPEWFHGRPSATDDDAAMSGGSNLGPNAADLAAAIRARVDAVLALEGPYTQGLDAADVPVDLVTSSASGLDPDISPEAARFQAPRIAAERGLPIDDVLAIIEDHTQGRTLGVFGEPRVNVLALNLALEEASG